MKEASRFLVLKTPAVIALMLCRCASAQEFVDADHIRKVKRAFETLGATPTLQCEIKPVQPALDFRVRLHAGYKINVPLDQFHGSGHGWSVLLRVMPSAGEPVYLASTSKLPDVPTNHGVDGEVTGGFVVGEGSYAVTLLVEDDQKRTCHNSWRIDAKLDRAGRGLQPAMPPNTVGEISGRFPRAQLPASPKFGRLTILVHAAPRSTRVSTLQDDDTRMLVGMLSALMEQLPARELRLVVFNLEQQQIVMRSDHFLPDEIDNISKAINELQLASVDYSVLSNPKGTVDLLTGFVESELHRENSSDAVIFLGPHSRTIDPIPPLAVDGRQHGLTQFFYLQYQRLPRPQASAEGFAEARRGLPMSGLGRRRGQQRPMDRESETTPDSIEQLMKRLKGRTMFLAKPHDFVEALARLGQLEQH